MYSVFIEERARRALKKLPKDIRSRINNSVIGLQSNPRPHGFKKLKNSVYYRIRIGDYNLNRTLKEQIGYFSQFKFCLFESISDAFFYECKIYHYLSDNTFIINEAHPQPPHDKFLKCPVVANKDII